MFHRLRSLACGVSVALAGSVLATAPAPAHAETGATAPVSTVDYSCQQYLLGLPTGAPFDLPLSLGVLDTVTVPVGGTLGSITGSLGLSGLTGAVADLVRGLLGGAQSLTFTLAGAAYTVPLSGASLSLPAVTVPAAPGGYPLLAPQTFDLSRTLGGVLTTVTCVLADVDRVVTTVLVQAPPPGTGAGPVLGGAPATVDPARPNPCTTLPARRAGQRVARLKARAARLSWRKRPSVAVSVAVRRKPARGRVIACYGALQVGEKRLRGGRATLRTVRFHPGLYRLRVVYLGSPKAAARRTTIPLRARK